MSTQWEVVTKSKKSKNIIEKKLGYVERKKIIESGPKLEEILPSHQIKSILSNVNKDKNKEKKQVQQNNKNSTSTPKKSKPVEKTEKAKSQNPQQPAKPKNLEAALNAIQPDDLENLLENLKVSYPGSELLWLKGVASFLNSNLHYETDPIFAGKSLQYPSVVVPKALKTVIISLFESVEEVTLFYFFDQMLTGVAMDMSKNQPSLGNKVLLQLVAQGWPHVCSNNLAKNAILKNSYQNRSSIGLSLLWALGQGGYKDLTVGIKVWQNIMLSLIELKSYSRFVCSYIEKVLTSADNNDSKLTLTQDEFLATYNALKASYNSLPKDCQQMLNESSGLFVKKYIESAPKLQNLFSIFFRNIDSLTDSQLDVSACIYALMKSPDCFKIWKMNYKKNILPSCALFNKIFNDWEDMPNSFTGCLIFQNFLKDAAQLNVELERKKDPNIPQLIELVKNLQDKPSQKKKTQTKGSSSICPWIFAIFLLVGAIGGIISYDVHTHNGVFEKSATGKLLKDTGALPYVEVAWYKTMSCSARGYKWAEENVPVYYETVKVFVKPYTNLARDLFKVACNGFTNLWETTKDYAEAKTPVVVELVEKYVPGLPKKIQDISISAWSTSVSAYQNGCDFFKTKVFVGTLSPENLSKALNDTQVAAAKYYSWFHEKVDAYAKIK